MARQMKDSGIAWIGEIPEQWEIVPLQYHADLNTESLGEDTAPDYEFDYVEIGSVTLEGGINEYEHVRFVDAPSRARRIVKENDIIVSTVRTYLKAIAIVPARENVIVSTGFAVLSPKNIDVGFLGYFLKSEYFANMVTANSVGISYPAINASDLVKFKILLPSNKEQQRIADFLDARCAEIDAVIERTKVTIEEYKKLKQAVITEAVTKGVRGPRKMKDSGIEWIGEIPEEWIVGQLGKYVSVHNGDRSSNYPTPEELLSEGIPFFTSFDIGEDEVRMHPNGKYLSRDKYLSMAGYKAKIGDIVFCLRGSIGKCALNLCYTEGTVASSLMGIRCESILNKFAFNLLVSNIVAVQNDLLMNGTCAANLSAKNVCKYRITVPPEEEQAEIVAFLDEKCAALDTLIAKKTTLLTELETYKKSLIYEYVTGKKEVM